MLAPFSAGSHIDVHLDGELVRQYSLCNPPWETHRYVIAVLREPASRGGSRAVHELQPEQEMLVSEPRNHFALAPAASRHLLQAGGIGITPIPCMAEHLAKQGGEYSEYLQPEGRLFPETILWVAACEATGRRHAASVTTSENAHWSWSPAPDMLRWNSD